MKSELRNYFRNILRDISSERRRAVELALFESLEDALEKTSCSFYSMYDEISLHSFNQILCDRGNLILSRMEDSGLTLYRVRDMKKDLENHQFGFKQPQSERCEKVSLDAIDLILVPALSFDKERNRLGRGKGFYDRLLTSFKNLSHVGDKPKTQVKKETIGVGFKEQLYEELLPTDVYDQKVGKLLLV